MHVLFLTTVDASYSVLLTTWLALLLHSLSSQVVLDSKGSTIDYSLAVGCMPSAHRIGDGNKADRLVSLLSSGINCTHTRDIPGFENDGKKHLKKFFVSYPDVRRMMMVKAFATTGKYDMIVYSDLDAFIVRNPVPDLMQYWSSNYSTVFSREHYNSSVVCNGFYALMDMSLPKHWIYNGVFSQNEVNNWISSEHKDSTTQYVTMYDMKHPINGVYRVGLLPEPDYFRGGCGSLMVASRRVEHCHSNYFNGKEKMKTFARLNRLIASADEQEQQAANRVLSGAIEASTEREVTNFVYIMRDSKTRSNGSEYSMVLHSHRLRLSSDLSAAIHKLPKWKGIDQAYNLSSSSSSRGGAS